MDQDDLARLSGGSYLRATLSLVPTDAGGRRTRILSGYRPNFWTGRTRDGQAECLGATILMVGEDSLAPGETSTVLLVLFSPENWQGIRPGALVDVNEGERLVGTATITSEMSAFDPGEYRNPT